MFCLLVGVLAAGWLAWRDISARRELGPFPAATIDKQPIHFAIRTFDPAAPPADMPRLAFGEEAVCDSNFLSNANVSGQPRKTDATHATVTITQIKMTLGLTITIWAPAGATQHVMEHEDGHREISEYYYRTADKIAERIAARYIGTQVEITGTDLAAESSKVTLQTANAITDQYNKELSPEPAQQLYDSLTDHSRNDVNAKEATAAAIRNAGIPSTQPTSNPGN